MNNLIYEDNFVKVELNKLDKFLYITGKGECEGKNICMHLQHIAMILFNWTGVHV